MCSINVTLRHSDGRTKRSLFVASAATNLVLNVENERIFTYTSVISDLAKAPRQGLFRPAYFQPEKLGSNIK